MLGLFSGELIFGGACYRREFCVSKWVEQFMGLYLGGLIGRIFASEIWGAYFREGLFIFFFGGGGGVGLIIGILRYAEHNYDK